MIKDLYTTLSHRYNVVIIVDGGRVTPPENSFSNKRYIDHELLFHSTIIIIWSLLHIEALYMSYNKVAICYTILA